MKETIRKRVVRILAAASALLIAFPWLLSPAAQETAEASSIRLTSLEGTVSVSGQGGKAVTAFENMRVLSGYSLETGSESYAGFSLDDVKAAKLDALSEAEVRKKGKKLELLLSKGSVFCDIKEPLEAEETMNVRTSTMITGIRGTVLYVKAVDQNTSIVYVLEGNVTMQSIDPATGERVSVSVGPGQKGIAVTHTGAGGPQGEPTVNAYVEAFSQEEIDGYVLTQIAADEELARRLEEAGWDILWIKENADRRLEEDQRKAAGELAGVGRLEDAGDKPVFDQVYGSEDSDSDSDGAQDRRTVAMTMPVTAEEVAAQLGSADVIIGRGQGDLETYELLLDRDLTVPGGGRLEIGQGIDLQVQEGASLQVDGTLTVAGELYNSGAIVNTGLHTLELGGNYRAAGTLDNTGKVRIAGDLTAEGGAVRNRGKGSIDVQGEMNVAQVELDLSGGAITVGGDLILTPELGERCSLGSNMEVNGVLNLRNGVFGITGGVYRNGAVVDGALEMLGGSLLSGGAEYGIMAEGGADVRLTGGAVCAQSGALAAVLMDGGQLSVEANVLRVTDALATGFVAGHGTLNLPGHADLDIENLDEDYLEAVEGADGWELRIFSPAARREAAKRRSAENNRAAADGQTAEHPVASPAEAEKGETLESEPGQEPEAEQGQEPEVEPEQGQEPEVEPEQGQKPEIEPEQGQEPEIEPEQGQEPEIEPEQGQEPEIEPEQGQEPKVEPEQGQEPKVEPEQGQEPEGEPEQGQEPDPGQGQESQPDLS